jgi:hypothetical protein
MSSTYSNLKFELITTGEQSGTWGATTNTNIGTAIEQAIVGMATLTSSDFTANVATLALSNTNALQNARALCLNIAAGAVSAAGTINVPAIQKPYVIINDSSYTVTVKVSGLTGVAVPSGKRTVVYNNGTDVGDQVNYLTSLSLGTALPVASGGSGATTASGARTNFGATTVGGNLFTLTNPSAVTYLRLNADNTVSALDASTFRTAIGAGTGSGTVTSVAASVPTFLSISGSPITSSGTLAITLSGTALPVANGGTGLISGTSGGVLYYSASGTLTSSAALAASALVVGGGAGVAPSTVTTGSGVLTALAAAANAAAGLVTGNGTATLTNKRIDPRVTSTTSASSLTPSVATADIYAYTALAANLTINAPTGTPVDGDKLMFRILDNGTSRTLTWNATYTAIGVTLPTATTISKMVYVGCIYNAANTRWDVVAVTTQA